MAKQTREDINRQHDLLRVDPSRYIEEINEMVSQSPNDPDPYFTRHYGWLRLGQLERALDDLNRSLELEIGPVPLKARGLLYMKLGRLRDAATDFSRAQAIDPDWKVTWGLLYQAHCHALLGDERAALEACNALPEDHWSPGLHGAPGGNKEQVIDGIRRTLGAKREPND